MKIAKKLIKGKEYFYLEHSYRVRTKVEKEAEYLGTAVPEDVEVRKAKLMDAVNQKRWFGDLDRIKKNFFSEFTKMPALAKAKYLENFLITFTYNTNRIEGSTLTLKETARLLEDGITPNKPLKDVMEAEAHKRVFELMLAENGDLNLKLVLAWHSQLMKDVSSEIAGKIRTHPVGIAGSRFEPPAANDVSYLLRQFFQWYHNHKDKTHPVELAALVHLKFVTIHPFTDGNGRVSRLLMNFILQQHGFPMLNIQYTNRTSYYNALERSQTKEQSRIFVQYLIKRYLKEYQRYL
jgi:Fic family protein